jgi:urease accessory protein
VTVAAGALLAALMHADSALPSGGFAFSWGLEELYDDGLLDERRPFDEVLRWYLETRWTDFDRYFVCHSCTATPREREELDRFCTASSMSAACRESSARAGRSLLMAWSRIGMAAAADYAAAVRAGSAVGNLPVVQGLIYSEHGMDQTLAAAVSGWSLLSNLASAAVRLGRVSALSAQSSIAAMLPLLSEQIEKPLPDIPFSWGVVQDIAMERHALRTARLFAS